MKNIFLSLGSSIGDAKSIFVLAEKELETRGVKIIQKSKNLKNAPYGGVAENDFTNAVWEVATDLKPEDLLRTLQEVESEQGRVRDVKWADRTLDIDILIYGEVVCESETLTLPHPKIAKRVFVLGPWSEFVDENFEIPTLGRLSELLEHVSDD